MAEWGKGDPRWIVEERSDAHNVNNWHWREADASEWSKDFLKSCLTSIEVDTKSAKLCISEVTLLDGDASACVRKGKFICIFDWEKITAKWTANVAGVTESFFGTMKVEAFDHDAEEDDLIFSSAFDKSLPEHQAIKDILRNKIPERVWEACKLYKETLRRDFAEKLAFHKQPSGSEQNNNQTTTIEAKMKTAIQLDQVKPLPKAAPTKPATQGGAKITTKCIKMNETFQGSCGDVYKAFLEIDRVKAWSRNTLKHDTKGVHMLPKGASFTLYDGNVKATIQSLKPDEELVMKWRLDKDGWPQDHYSQVTITLKQDGPSVNLSLEQKQVPSTRVEQTTKGWKNFYFNAMKQTLGLGGITPF